MRKKVLNPYVGKEGYHCFACDPQNHLGLQMEFYEEGEYLVCDWKPKAGLAGYHNILHGGIQATLLDEIGSWFVQIKLKTAGVTFRLEIRYKKPVYMDQERIRIKAFLKEIKRNLAFIHVAIYDFAGMECAEGEVVYYTFSPDEAHARLNYPGVDSFYAES